MRSLQEAAIRQELRYQAGDPSGVLHQFPGRLLCLVPLDILINGSSSFFSGDLQGKLNVSRSGLELIFQLLSHSYLSGSVMGKGLMLANRLRQLT